MNKSFFVDESSLSAMTYSELIIGLNSNQEIFPVSQIKEAMFFFVNFIHCLVANENITLLDYDFTNQEIQNLEIKGIGENKRCQIKIENTDQLIYLLSSSKSQIMFFTSGTTGVPKKVIHSVNNLIRFVRVSPKNCNDIWGFSYNPTHIAGIQVFLQALLNKNTIIYLFGQNREFVNQQIEKHTITHISCIGRASSPLHNLRDNEY